MAQQILLGVLVVAILAGLSVLGVIAAVEAIVDGLQRIASQMEGE